MEKLTKNFSREELACKCGCDKCDMTDTFLKALQHLRDIVKFPITINSGYRCDEHNRAVGGAMSSKHKLGQAADLDLTSLSPHQVQTLLEAIKLVPEIKGVGVAKSFVHIDTREFPAEWKY